MLIRSFLAAACAAALSAGALADDTHQHGEQAKPGASAPVPAQGMMMGCMPEMKRMQESMAMMQAMSERMQRMETMLQRMREEQKGRDAVR
jgi:hypothetical protein